MNGTSRWAARLRTATESVPESIAMFSQTRISRLRKYVQGSEFWADRRDALAVPGVGLDLHSDWVPQVLPVEAADRRVGVEVGPEAALHAGMRVDPLGGGRVEACPAGEDEAAAVGDPEVDRAGPEVVGQAEQVLGRVDDVVGDPEGARDHVGRAAGEDGYRDVGAGEAVRHLVEGAVPSEGDDDVIAAVDGLATDLRRMVLRLGRDRLDVVAALKRVDDEALEPIGDRRRVGIDDDQHPPLRGRRPGSAPGGW